MISGGYAKQQTIKPSPSHAREREINIMLYLFKLLQNVRILPVRLRANRSKLLFLCQEINRSKK